MPDEPRCQYISPAPWGWTQCALPEGHNERHAFDPNEAIVDRREEG